MSTTYDSYKVVELWFKKYGTVKAQLDSFTSFLDNIRTVLHDEPPLVIGGEVIRFENVTFLTPSYLVNGISKTLYPSIARMKGLNYEFTMCVDVINETTGVRDNGVELCQLPCMVGSEMCNLKGMSDAELLTHGEILGIPGGYFIHNGVERVLIGHIKPAYNTPIVYKTRNDKWICQLRSMNDETAKSKAVAITRSNSGALVVEFDSGAVRTTITTKSANGKEDTSTSTTITAGAKVFLVSEVMRDLLGGDLGKLKTYLGGDYLDTTHISDTVDEILQAPENLQVYPELVRVVRECINNGEKPLTITTTIKKILVVPKRVSTKVIQRSELYNRLEPVIRECVKEGADITDIMVIVNNAAKYKPLHDYSTLFMHIGIRCDNVVRAHFLGNMIRRYVLTEKGAIKEESREQYSKKRVDFAGTMCLDLFKMTWKQFLIDAASRTSDRCNPINAINAVKRGIGYQIKMCFVHGRWGAKNAEHKTIGIVEAIPVKTSVATSIDSLRRMKLQVHKENKDRSIRKLCTSHAFFACCVETTEGADVGIRLALAAVAFASVRQPTMLVRDIIEFTLLDKLKPTLECVATSPKYAAILLNGTPIGYVEDHEITIKILRKLRDLRRFNDDVSISMDYIVKCIDVWCDCGRFVRPLLVKSHDMCEKIMEANTMDELEQSLVVVHRDAIEISRSEIAMTPNEAILDDYEYSELNPSCMLGLLAGEIPYANYTPSPRACYKTNMARQSMGILPSISKFNNHSNSIHLNYAQAPIITTRCAKATKVNEYPNGINAIVAVMAHTGFNQEDSIIINKSALDRGMFNATQRREITVDLRIGTIVDDMCKPPEDLRIRANYDNIGEDGLPIMGSIIKKGDALLGKVSTDRNTSRREDTSIIARMQDEGVVKSVKIDGSSVRIRLEVVLDVMIGDKFCSAMAQKGTCGMILPDIDMPFVADSGMIPDILVNVHSMPSRMTVNQIMASMAGKLACITARNIDGSPFQLDVNDVLFDLCEQLAEVKYDKDGCETMCNGLTGEMFSCPIFIGVVYYLRPVQLVRHKIFSSTTTTMRNHLTRQPLNGRAHEGGLRVGEMEKDDLLRHGSINFLQERMLTLSDKHIMMICTICGSESHVALRSDGSFVCLRCKQLMVNPITIPYAAKLFFQYLQGVGLGVKYNISK
ncbi:RNA polymerase subunit [Trichoplusia ni ascovirus 2c]|uniref:RNA polymerase subunit n=1 Tax=Trichoplusia ni ascovirus 2c TaxID=328615 RepID=UPI0000E44262|nr:RNA polymerase subunit [Trichoplusia ni ascovirus 2c]ABF70655.1 RNA polymerase subunit [Trichoplusia ni ascovirus 2c]AUS94250.1 DNA-directed RNA plymerase [Trichoplusia ni ascovirus 6b]